MYICNYIGTNRKIAGSITGGISWIFNRFDPSGYTMAFGQPNLFQKRVLGILRGGKGGRCLKLITLPLCVPGV
jgi:hypothetical protein